MDDKLSKAIDACVAAKIELDRARDAMDIAREAADDAKKAFDRAQNEYDKADFDLSSVFGGYINARLETAKAAARDKRPDTV